MGIVPDQRGCRIAFLAACWALLTGAAPAPATAATQIGETFTPSFTCGSIGIWLQTSSPNGQYTVQSDGVITSWSYLAAGSVPQLKFKVARPVAGSTYTVIGESGLQTLVPGALNTFAVGIPVRVGDVIGFHDAVDGPCGTLSGSYSVQWADGDVPAGTTTNFPNTSPSKLDLSATLEPDCDSDGFGDESQDSDISSCSPDTAAPDTTITKRPKDKTKKKQAIFEFTSNEPGSTFECALDGAPFTACSSPDTVKVKKGKHHFEVRATDAAGNVDGSPASDDWKRKKKKK